jgi:hypothetical protein
MLGQQTDWQIKLLEALLNQPSLSLSGYGTQSFSEKYFTNFINSFPRGLSVNQP